MDIQRWRAEWGDLLVTSIISFILYQFNMLVLFCIPLQILFLRKGEKQLLYGSASVIATIIVVGVIRTASIDDALLKRSILLMDIALPAFILAGFIAVDLPWKIDIRTLFKVLIVVLAAGLVSIPAIYLISRNNGFTDFLRSQVESIAGLLQIGIEETDPNAIAVDIDALVANVIDILLKNYLFVYFLTVAGSVWIGRAIAARFSRTITGGFRSFHIPDRIIWPLLASWALVLVDYLVGIGSIAYAVWNIGLILLFVYGMQGIGIIQTFLDRRNVSRYFRILLAAGMIMFVFWPGINLVILIGLPVLGVTEMWIHFRKVHKE
jgi:hypothetical protein